MSRKYIGQVDSQNFVFPNNQVSEYDVDIIHDVNDNCVSGSVINFTVTGRTSTGMTINFDYIWDLNGATPFVRNSNAVSVLSLHMMAPQQNYYKPFLCVGRFVFSDIPITRIESGVTPGFNRLSFLVTPAMMGLTTFIDGTYYFEIKFIGERCVFPVCFSQSITACTTPFINNQTVLISNGGSFTLTPIDGMGNIVPFGTTYTWTYADNPNITGEANQPVPQSSITGGPLTNSAGTTQSVVYTVTPYNGSCTGSTFTVTVSVLAGVTPTPTATPTSTPTPTPTATPTPTPTPTTTLGCAQLDWSFSESNGQGTMDLYVNGSVIESRSSNSSGSYTVCVGDTINVQVYCDACLTSPNICANAYSLSNKPILVDADCNCEGSASILTSVYTVVSGDIGGSITLGAFASCDVGCI